MSFYDELSVTALELLTAFGQPITRRSYTEGVYSPATGLTTPSAVDTARTGAIFDYGSGSSLVRGGLIQGTDKRLLVDGTDSVNPQDHFIVNNIEYVIVSVGLVGPAGIAVLYDVHLRA